MIGRLWVWGMSNNGWVDPLLSVLTCLMVGDRYHGCMHVTKSGLKLLHLGRRTLTLCAGLLADLDILLTVAGYPSLKDINRDALRFCPYGIAPGARL